MENKEIIESWEKEIRYLTSNIVLNNCKICKKVYRQIFTSNVCNNCEKQMNVF